MNTLVILTKKFPFGKQETYLFDELRVLEEKFDKIYIVPHDEFSYLDSENRLTSSKVEIVNVNNNLKGVSFFNKVISLWYAIKGWSIDLFKRNNKRLVLKNSKAYIVQSLHASAQAQALSLHLDNNSERNNDLIFYNYWLHRGVIVSHFFKGLWQGRLKVVSRAHSYDVYHDRWFDIFPGAHPKFLPFQFSKIETCDQIYCISSHAKNHFINDLKIAPSKIKVARLGVYDRCIDFKLKVTFNEEKILLTCSWITELKRVHLMPSIIHNMKHKVKWIHIGGGADKDQEKLNAEIKKYNLEDRVQLTGNMTNEDIMTLYTNTPVDLVLNLSFVEGIPVSLMEAAMFGFAMLATNTVGNPEIVNADNGILVPVDFSVNKAGVLIDELLADETLMKSKQIKARETFLELYHAKNNYTNFADAIVAN